MATIKYLCRECGTEVKTAVDEVAFCEAHPSAVIESVVVADDVRINLPRAPKDADWGVNEQGFRDVRVSANGTVRAWDEVAGHYSVGHDLTPDEVAEAKRLAGLVFAGTHYEAAGRVYPKGI